MLKQVMVLLAVGVLATSVSAVSPGLVYDAITGQVPGAAAQESATYWVNQLEFDTDTSVTNIDVVLYPGGQPSATPNSANGGIYQHQVDVGSTIFADPTFGPPSASDIQLDSTFHTHSYITDDSYAGLNSDPGSVGGGPSFGIANISDTDFFALSAFENPGLTGVVEVAQLGLDTAMDGSVYLAVFESGAGGTAYTLDVVGGKIYYPTSTPVIPLPASAWMGIALLGGLGVKRLINRTKTA
jgi:hypothetical protein